MEQQFHDEVDISVGSGAIKLFERIEISLTNAFCEFIDNSLQSFLDHEKELKQAGQSKCVVEVSWTNDQIIFRDNAYGMNLEAFGRAMRWNAPAAVYPAGSLSKYGMGLKYAAINLGAIWEIQTTELGSPIEFKGVVDSDYLFRENPKTLPLSKKEVKESEHYSVITIKKLHKKLSSSDFKDSLKKLGTIYQYYLDKGKLTISINNAKVTYTEPKYAREPKNDTELYEVISDGKFMFDGKIYEYTGAIGILDKGGYRETGFTLMQNHRGMTLNYKPSELFGVGGTYKALRLVGTIEFIGDNWIARVNKDGLLWNSSGLEEKFIENLKSKESVKKILTDLKEITKAANRSYKVTSKAIGANVYDLKMKYKLNDVVSFRVSPFQGYSVKEVKCQSILLIPNNPNTGEYSFSITADMPDNIRINITTSQDLTLPPDKTVPHPQNPASSPLPPALDPFPVPPVSRFEKLVRDINSAFKPLENLNIAFGKVDSGQIFDQEVVINFKDVSFGIKIEEINDPTASEWIEFVEKPSFARSYELTINYAAGLFNRIGLNEETKKCILIMAIIVSLSKIVSPLDGVKKEDAHTFISTINKIITKAQ